MNLRELPHIKYHQYGKSFLMEAILRVDFNEITSFEKLCPELNGYFKEILNIKDRFEQQNEIINCVVIQNTESTMAIEITPVSVEFTMRPPAYGCFADMQKFVDTVSGFFDVIGIDKFQKMSICKKNVWALKSNKAQDRAPLLSMIFSKAMLKSWMIEAAEDEAASVCGQTCSFAEDGMELKVVNGFKKKHDITKFYLNLTATDNNPDCVGNMNDIMAKLNDIIFDGFNWAITNDMINLLKEE